MSTPDVMATLLAVGVAVWVALRLVVRAFWPVLRELVKALRRVR